MQSIRLLPNYFKYLGLGLLIIYIATFGSALLFKLPKTEILSLFLIKGLIIILLIFTFTKNKIEDERTMYLRLVSLATSFLLVSGIAIFSPILEFAFNFSTRGMASDQVILTALLLHLVGFQMRIRNRG